MTHIKMLWLLGVVLTLAGLRGAADEEHDLGGMLYRDTNLSLNRNQACATCHGLQAAPARGTGHLLPAPGFVDPLNVSTGTPVSKGSVEGQAGVLNAPSVAYTAFSPQFHWSAEDGTYVGGQFWNGRAPDLQSQAAMPFLNPVEMALPSAWAVVSRIRENAAYAPLFERVYGIRLPEIPAFELAPATAEAPPEVLAVYAAATQAISEFERGPEFHKFNSKYDYWLAGRTQLTAAELRGFTLFTNEAKANCSACHPAGTGVDATGRITPPLFTDFTYDNIGLPRNLRIPGTPPPDPGLAGRADVAAGPAGTDQWGKQKVMTLRNIAVTPPYGHNGVLETLEQVVHFYNTRDTLGRVESNLADGFGLDGWPAPEVDQGVNTEELGHLGLSASDEADIVAFLNTLTDDYPESGKDPNVPPGTPSPFPYVAPPPIPVRLVIASPDRVQLFGRLGKSYRLEATDVLGAPGAWSPWASLRLVTNGSLFQVSAPADASQQFFRAVEDP